MSTDIAYFVTYPCPRCGDSLEARTDDWQDWLRCPSCGKAGKPPLPRRMARAEEQDVLYIGTISTGPPRPQGNGAAPAFAAGAESGGLPPMARVGGGALRRVIMGGGFFLALFLALVSVGQQNPTQAGIFGFVAFLLLALLAQSSRRP